MTVASDRSQLQMQMGQEVIYLLLTASMLGCIILAAYVLLNITSSAELQKEVTRLTLALSAAEKKVGEVTAKEARQREVRAPTKPTDRPPIIVLPEAAGYYFEAGSAEITSMFEQRIRTEIVPQIVLLARSYEANIIEIIGHTDGIPVGPNLRDKANLDFTVAAFVEGQQSQAPIPFDNAGLGMARAIAIAKQLRATGLAVGYQILPLSAGSLISPADRYSPSGLKDNDQARRRIEIRLRRRQV